MHPAFFSITRRSRSDVRQSVTQSADRDFTDVTLAGEDTMMTMMTITTMVTKMTMMAMMTMMTVMTMRTII